MRGENTAAADAKSLGKENMQSRSTETPCFVPKYDDRTHKRKQSDVGPKPASTRGTDCDPRRARGLAYEVSGALF